MALWKKTGPGDPPGPLGKYITMYNNAVKTLGTDNPEVLKRFFETQQQVKPVATIQQNNNINKNQPKESKLANVAGDVGTLALSTLQNFGMNIPGDLIKTVMPKAAVLDILPQTNQGQYLKQRGQTLGQNLVDVGDAANTVAAFEIGAPLVGKGIQAGVKYASPYIKSGIEGIKNFRFKPNENMMYRGIGEKGMKDAIESGYFKSPRPNFNTTYWTNSDNFDRAVRSGNTGFKPTSKTSEIYIAEYPKNKGNFEIRYARFSPEKPLFEDFHKHEGKLPLSEGRILKKHWLRGYKEVKIPKEDISFYHFSKNNNLTLNDIDVLRTGESQMKKRYLKYGEENLPSGFYTHRTKYPRFMAPGNPYEIKMPHNIKIKDLVGDGMTMTDRITKKQIIDYQKKRIDVLKGKNMTGQDEFIIINKKKIKSFKPIERK